MKSPWTRRSFLAAGPLGLVGTSLVASPLAGWSVNHVPTAGRRVRRADLLETFPYQDPELVRAVVGASHSNIDRVRELVGAYPELAKSSWDWGFGDWESALGAASHTGRVEIAEYLLAHGARPNLFTAAMLGQLAVVKATIEAQPGVQSTPGPHGITLLAHARAGRERAAAVYDYLSALGDADPRPVSAPMSEEEHAGLLGTYRFGAGDDETLVVTDRDGTLFLARADQTARGLTHLGDREFHPAGAPSVRVLFVGGGQPATVRVTMGTEELEAEREV